MCPQSLILQLMLKELAGAKGPITIAENPAIGHGIVDLNRVISNRDVAVAEIEEEVVVVLCRVDLCSFTPSHNLINLVFITHRLNSWPLLPFLQGPAKFPLG